MIFIFFIGVVEYSLNQLYDNNTATSTQHQFVVCFIKITRYLKHPNSIIQINIFYFTHHDELEVLQIKIVWDTHFFLSLKRLVINI